MEGSTLKTQNREKLLVAASSVLGAIIITALKTAVGISTGSLGILAEAAHSALDLVAALLTFFAVRVSDRPADDSHPYGHGKVESLSALGEVLLLLITCVWIIYEAINRLFFHSVEVDPSVWAFVVMLISIAVDWSRSRALSRVARKYSSQALEADALHFRTDIWSSTVVIIGLALVLYGERSGQKSIFIQADAFAALLVALIVIYVSITMGRKTIDVLVDRAPVGLADEISTAVSRVEDVRKVLQTRVRQVGNQIFVDLRLAVPRHLSFAESHAITHNAQEAVRKVSLHADVVVHAFPAAESEGVLEKIHAVAANGRYAVHNITTHWTQRGMWIDLDLEVDPQLSFEHAHAVATELESQLRSEFVKQGEAKRNEIADINVHIEPREQLLAEATEFPAKDASEYVKTIERVWKIMPHVRRAEDIALQRLGGNVYLSLHLVIDADRTIAQVHNIAEQVERRLRREFPELGRVVIHTEPFVEEAS